MDDVDFNQLEAVLDGQQQSATDPAPAVSQKTDHPVDHTRDHKHSVATRDVNGSGKSRRYNDDQRRRSRSGSLRRSHRDGSAHQPRSDSNRGDRYSQRSRTASSRSPSGVDTSDRDHGDRRRQRGRQRSVSSESYDKGPRHSSRHYKSRSRRRSSGTRSASPSTKAQRDALQEEQRLREVRDKEEARKKQEEERRLKEEDEKRRKELDEARRDDLTVLILNLSLKASERDVWKFFSERAGKVRDIQIIRDSRSGKSKGVGYVEFYAPQAVLQALALSGSYIMDVPIVVQASQAEKNRAAKAAKQQAAEITEGGPMKIYVGGLTDSLSTLTESDLKQLFSPFGDIVHVDLHKDPYTGRCKGYGFIQFQQSQDAREAMAAMNGFDIGGRQIKVGYATDAAQRGQLTPSGTGESAHGLPFGNSLTAAQNALQTALMFAESQADNERLDDEGGGLLSGVNPRISLMQKLQRLDQSSNTSSMAQARVPFTHPGIIPTATTASAIPTVTPPLLGGLGDVTSSLGAAGVHPTTALFPGAAGLQTNAVVIPGASALQIPGGAPPAFTCNICLEGLFTATDLQAEGPGFLDEIVEDVRTECSKYGVVIQVWLSRKAVDGKVWVKFGGPDQAVKAHQALNGRYFAGNRINVSFVSDPTWSATCVDTQ